MTFGLFSPDTARQLEMRMTDVKKTRVHIVDFITESSASLLLLRDTTVQSLLNTPPPTLLLGSADHMFPHRDTDKCDLCKQPFAFSGKFLLFTLR